MFIKIDSHRQFDNAVKALGRSLDGYYASDMSGARAYVVDESEAARLAAGKVRFTRTRKQDVAAWSRCWAR